MNIIDNINIHSITKMKDFLIGNAEDKEGGTGCTVILSSEGAVTGVAVRGGGPATRETDRLSPLCKNEINHGIVLSGGSAFGLDASAGVMEFLEKKNIGFDTGFGKIPLVAGASIFDLVVGNPKCRPDKKMGYDACVNAYNRLFHEGSHGAGTGATVGKFLGPERMMKSGIGTYAIKIGELEIGAIVVVNSLGDVYDLADGRLLAGVLNEDQTKIIGAESVILEKLKEENDFFGKNTTIGCLLTNAILTNSEAAKVSSMAHNGLAQVIWPVHTSADGDTLFTMASCKTKADTDILGALGSQITAKAINNAVKNTKSEYGLKVAEDFN